jgi:hypothetical protein
MMPWHRPKEDPRATSPRPLRSPGFARAPTDGPTRGPLRRSRFSSGRTPPDRMPLGAAVALGAGVAGPLGLVLWAMLAYRASPWMWILLVLVATVPILALVVRGRAQDRRADERRRVRAAAAVAASAGSDGGAG